MSEQERHTPPAGEDLKDDSSAPISIKVVDAENQEVHFKIKKTTKLGKLQAAYATKVGKDVGTIRFLYDGLRVNEEATPSSLGMENEDTIDVMVEQVGGLSWS